ncbi:restriction endonuclease [Actinomycetes bacterium NPDC127524]
MIFYNIMRAFLYRRRLKRAGIHQIDKMTGTQFEQYLELLFTQKGYKVSLTKSTGDFGADLILKSTGGKTIIVQAKRYSKNVGIKAVQEVVSAVPHYKGTEAWVVTNSYYTEAAKKLAVTNNVQLYNRDQLIKWILEEKSA